MTELEQKTKERILFYLEQLHPQAVGTPGVTYFFRVKDSNKMWEKLDFTPNAGATDERNAKNLFSQAIDDFLSNGQIDSELGLFVDTQRN